MTYQTCEDCGTKLSGGFCPNCHEETFIAEQYRDLGKEVPEGIVKKEAEQAKFQKDTVVPPRAEAQGIPTELL